MIIIFEPHQTMDLITYEQWREGNVYIRIASTVQKLVQMMLGLENENETCKHKGSQ